MSYFVIQAFISSEISVCNENIFTRKKNNSMETIVTEGLTNELAKIPVWKIYTRCAKSLENDTQV